MDFSQWTQGIEAHTSFATMIGAAMAAMGLLLLLAGARLVQPALFLSAFTVLFVPSLLFLDWLLTELSVSSSTACTTVCVVPAVLGLLAGLLALRLLTLAFSWLGFAVGAALGQMLYILIFHHISLGVHFLNHDLMWFICIFGLAIPSATLMARQQHSLLVLATSAMGAVLLVPAFAFLIFCRIDDRFLWVVDPSTNNPHLSSPFVYGQILGALLYFAVGVTCQRSSRRSKRELGREEAPYHGFHEGNAKNVRP
jgi:hypothetical protein